MLLTINVLKENQISDARSEAQISDMQPTSLQYGQAEVGKKPMINDSGNQISVEKDD